MDAQVQTPPQEPGHQLTPPLPPLNNAPASKVVGAMAKARTEITGIKKNGEMSDGAKFKYAKVDDFLDAVSPVLAKHGVIHFVEEMTAPVTVRSWKTAKGNTRFIVGSHVTVAFCCEGEVWRVRHYYQAEDSGDKIQAKLVSSALKFILRTCLGIPTGDEYGDIEDKDSNGGYNEPGQPEEARRTLGEQALAALLDIAANAGVKEEDIRKRFHVEDINDLTEEQGVAAGNWLNGRIADLNTKINAIQIAEIENLYNQAGADLQKTLDHYQVTCLADLNVHIYKSIKATLTKKIEEAKGGSNGQS